MFVAVSGPSGAGKTSIVNAAVACGAAERMVPVTTRRPRPAEAEGIDFEFISRLEFAERIRACWFCDWDYVLGEFYGYGNDLSAGAARLQPITVGPMLARMAVRLRHRHEFVRLVFLDDADDILDERTSHRRTTAAERMKRDLHRDEERQLAFLFDVAVMRPGVSTAAAASLIDRASKVLPT